MYRLDSSSQDAHKMFGDMTPGGITHQDVILQHIILTVNHFKDTFRNMPKDLPMQKRLFGFFPFLKDDMICAACKKHLKNRYTKCNMQFVVYD